jgi:hypothetical protein
MEIMLRRGLEFLEWIYLTEKKEHRVTNLRGVLNSAYLLTGLRTTGFRRRILPLGVGGFLNTSL